MRTALPIPFLSTVLALCIVGAAAHAALGDDVASVEADRVHMKASLRVVPATLFTVHEIAAPSGTVVKEFVSPAGKVFAVAWNGPFMPDLRQTLGRYFNVYQTGPRSRTMRRRLVQVNASDLVVVSGGRPRAFVGQAYVPSLMPAGVTAEQIK
jgi:Protein of unknown function (DUF2844)